MKKFVYILAVSFLLIASCSTRKNTFLNRGYHNTTTKYNILYNGNIALEKGINELANQYDDNYWEILPIEPMYIDEETPMIMPGESKEGEEKQKTSFDIAEEKAVKAVQKHSMYIDGDEHNKQIDDAYLLLGKSRYYSQRFMPALEAFDYLLKSFDSENRSNDLRIWKAKTQIRLQNEDRAIKTLYNLLSYGDIEDEIKEKTHTFLAMAYMAIDSNLLAIKQLEHAVETQYDVNQYARNLLILGQLHRKEGNIDSSQIALKKIVGFSKSPYKYKMHSYIEQAKNITDSTDFSELKEQYTSLIKVYENKAYLGELYYQNALMNFHEGNDTLALKNLTNSIHAPLIKNFQKGLSYEKAGDYYFDKAKFVEAGAYYDSVFATVSNDNTKRIRKLRRKRESLEEIIDYETLLKHNDSILTLVAMSDAERRAFFEQYIEKIKKANEIATILKENKERAKNNGGMGDPRGGSISVENRGKWYFYNAQAVGFGKAGFQRVWGNRELKDYWRLSEESSKLNNQKSAPADSLQDFQITEESKKYDIEHYLSSIPSDEEKIQKLHDENSNANYQLGLIYKEKFQEYSLATLRLKRFLSEKPKEKLILPAKYHLYRIYEKTGNPQLDEIKQQIISEYPESRFTQIIQNPEELTKAKKKNEPEAHYEKVYCDYEFERYTSVHEQCNEAIKQYIDDPIQVKFELLKSYTIYKLEGKKPFMTELEYVTVNYPKTEEAEHAQEMLDFLNGVKKPTKEKNDIKLKSKENKGNKKSTTTTPTKKTNTNRERSGKNATKRQPSRNMNNQENRGNRSGTRPPKGSNNTPSRNSNQTGDQLGDG